MGYYADHYSDKDDYYKSSNRLNYNDFFGTSVKDVCKDIKSRAEDLQDCAKKIKEVCTDLDDGETLVVDGKNYGEHIIGIANYLDTKYTALCAQCDVIDGAAKARRAQEDEWGKGYGKYLDELEAARKAEAEAKKNNQ